jgi:hypothetical protein
MSQRDRHRLFGNPDANFPQDSGGNLYLGSVNIEGYRRHTLHIRTDDRRCYALDQDGRATNVDGSFLKSIISAKRSGPRNF